MHQRHLRRTKLLEFIFSPQEVSLILGILCSYKSVWSSEHCFKYYTFRFSIITQNLPYMCLLLRTLLDLFPLPKYHEHQMKSNSTIWFFTFQSSLEVLIIPLFNTCYPLLLHQKLISFWNEHEEKCLSLTIAFPQSRLPLPLCFTPSRDSMAPHLAGLNFLVGKSSVSVRRHRCS